MFMEPFHLQDKLRAEPQPLFPGDVETSSRSQVIRLRASVAFVWPREMGTSAKHGYLKYVVERSGL